MCRDAPTPQPILHVSVAGNSGIWPVFHQGTSRWVRVNRSSHDSRALRHQRGSKIAVENHNPLRKLRDEEVKRARESHKKGLHSGRRGIITHRRGIKIPISPSVPLARGKGEVPRLHPAFSATTFAELERPLGPLPEEVSRPLTRLFETQATSRQFALVTPRRSFVEGFRAFAFTYPLAMRLLRLAVGTRQPQTHDMVNNVVALQRGEGLTGMARAASALAATQQLERLAAWYSR